MKEPFQPQPSCPCHWASSNFGVSVGPNWPWYAYIACVCVCQGFPEFGDRHNADTFILTSSSFSSSSTPSSSSHAHCHCQTVRHHYINIIHTHIIAHLTITYHMLRACVIVCDIFLRFEILLTAAVCSGHTALTPFKANCCRLSVCS